MEWFIEVVLVLDNRLKQWPSAPPLTSDDIRIGNNRVAHIDPPPSTSSTLRENAFSSDLSVICELFLTSLLILEDLHSLNSPVDPDNRPLIMNRIMVDILDSFVASKDIVFPKETEVAYFDAIIEVIPELHANFGRESMTIIHAQIRRTFARLVVQFSQAGQWILPEHSLFRQKDVENSKEFVDAVKDALKRYSKEKVREEFDSFEGWKGLMRKIVANEETVCDISFLRTWIFRPTLTSLLSKHQHLMSLRPPSLPLPSAHLASSLTDHSLTSSESNQLPFQFRTETDDMSTIESSIVNSDLHRGSSSSLTLSQTDTDPSSASLSLEAQPPPSPDTQSSSSPARSDTVWMISTLHSLISAPLLHSSSQRSTDYPLFSDVVQSVHLQPDPNEKFNSSLFDEEDDETIINSLIRCFYVSAVHRNLSHIDDPPAFVDRLFWTLRSSRTRLRVQSFAMLMAIVGVIGVEIVSESQFHNLRFAFRDGTKEEQTFLLWFWMQRIRLASPTNVEKIVDDIDSFDFDGFLTADLSEVEMLDYSISFVEIFWTVRALDPTTRRWAKDFLLRFERQQNVLTRICQHFKTLRDSSPYERMLYNDFIRYTSLLSFDHGISFPDELTRIILFVPDLDSIIDPSLCLNHTSLNPKYRSSVFPIEVLFERQARSHPSAFLRANPEMITRDSPRFLHTPLFGLHSLLLRGLFHPLTDKGRSNLAILLSMDDLQDAMKIDTLDLFSLFPPPLVIRLFVGPSQPLLTRPDHQPILTGILPSLVATTAPFGDCVSLKWMFQNLLTPHRDDEEEVTRLRDCRDVVIALHWLSIPSRFDSPLLAHLPSLISSHPPSLRPSLFLERGIRSLVTCSVSSLLDDLIESNGSKNNQTIESVIQASIIIRLSPSLPHLSGSLLDHSLTMINHLRSPFPAVVSVTLEMFHRLVLTCSDEAKMKLVKHGLLDVVMVAVSQSSLSSSIDLAKRELADIGVDLAAVWSQMEEFK
ncbi:hypothetical protein BLNAU_17328 [Blattamonas nauphoetae]|uniref:Uncharacterized protein n=1 Tax=Blattamonas nauphoetae TaxID=2049346 RepID=A0ABQ9X7N5_9EUKA|nr:hypothetical protein BLNAU_17328 [Blattamonas nauphoetae]